MNRPDNLSDLVDTIRTRPGLFFGSESLDNLSGFLNGYLLAIDWFEGPRPGDGATLPLFGRWLAEEAGLWPTPMGWLEILRTRAAPADDPLCHFFSEFDRFRGVTIERLVQAEHRMELSIRRPDGTCFLFAGVAPIGVFPSIDDLNASLHAAGIPEVSVAGDDGPGWIRWSSCPVA
jgi:hypothetical protein